MADNTAGLCRAGLRRERPAALLGGTVARRRRRRLHRQPSGNVWCKHLAVRCPAGTGTALDEQRDAGRLRQGVCGRAAPQRQRGNGALGGDAAARFPGSGAGAGTGPAGVRSRCGSGGGGSHVGSGGGSSSFGCRRTWPGGDATCDRGHSRTVRAAGGCS
ncbi:unnamed protein product, partial [Phaeothamnion confervicola]